MSIFREFPPTAGFAFSGRDLSALKEGFGINALENDFKSYLNCEAAYVAYSGTAALYFILEGLKEISNKKTVIIPSYICPLVPLAIARAGLKVEVCDIAGESFDFDCRQLELLCAENKDILAIIPAHLAGIPVDFNRVEIIAKKYGIFTVEDCAQSLGARYNGKKVGSLADFSFFSLARGKGLTIYEGGVAISNNKEYSWALERKIRKLSYNNVFSETLKVLELFGYWIFYNPYLFWFVFGLPQIFWNMRGRNLKAQAEEYTLNFGTHNVSKLRKLFGHASFWRLEDEVNKQRLKAGYYISELQNVNGLKIIKEKEADTATYPFLVLLFDDLQKRLRVLGNLQKKGLGASIVYTSAIANYDYLQDIVPQRNCSAAASLNCKQITLSTNAFLKQKDLAEAVKIIKEDG
jgi:dTDP-4-amino-4,6-dideoxygalactose transaminase